MRQGRKLSIKSNTTYFLTATIISWIDLFSRKELRNIVIESLRYCIAGKGLNVFAFCIMTNHLHLIANCNEPFLLSDTMRDFKRFTATACYKWILNNAESRRQWMIPLFQKAGEKDPKNNSVKIWQTGNHAIELYSANFTWTKLLYIHKNPVNAGFVEKPEDWIFSSARNYAGLTAVLPEVILIQPPGNYGL